MQVNTLVSITTNGSMRASVPKCDYPGGYWSFRINAPDRERGAVLVFCEDETEARELSDAINAVYARREAKEAA